MSDSSMHSNGVTGARRPADRADVTDNVVVDDSVVDNAVGGNGTGGAHETGTATPRRRHREVEPVGSAVRRPLQSLRRRWLPALALTALCTVGGCLVGATSPVTYTAEARVAVGAGDMSIGAIAGFPLAATDLASNYARYINDKGLQNQHAEGATMAASPIPESSIIRIEGTGTDQAAVVKATQSTADDLVKTANGTDTNADPDTTLAAYRKASTTWTQSQTAVDRAQTALAKVKANKNSTDAQLTAAENAYATATATATQNQQIMQALGAKYQNQIVTSSQAAKLLVVRKAEVSSTDRSSKIERFGLMGFVVGAALSLLLAVWLDRRRRGSDAN